LQELEFFFRNNLLLIIGFALGFLFVFLGISSLKKKRLIDDVPTSKIKGVFIGLVEIFAKVKPQNLKRSYISETECVYYDYTISEQVKEKRTVTYRDSKGRTRTKTKTVYVWKTVDSGGIIEPFFVYDDTGEIRVDPYNAKVEAVLICNRTCIRSDPLYFSKGPKSELFNSTHRRRFVEYALMPEEELYIMGQAKERQDVVAPEIAYDEFAPMFLISHKSEDKITKGLKLKNIAFLVASIAAVIILSAVHSKYEPLAYRYFGAVNFSALLIPTLIVAAGWFVLWFITVYNSLRRLKNSVIQADKQIDILLKRRYDLIPNLVNAVKGTAKYEKETLELSTKLRSEFKAKDTQDTLAIIIERYPDLKSNSSFQKLNKELIDTENRIELARNYYNNVCTFFNTRLSTFPDMIIAKMSGLKQFKLFQISELEKDKKIEVDLQRE